MILPSWAAPAALVALLGGSHWIAYKHGVSVESERREAAIANASAAGLLVARTVERAQADEIQIQVDRTNETISAIPDSAGTIDRLRDHSAALQRQLSEASAAAKRGEAATKAVMVYAELLDRANSRIGALEPVARRAVELARLFDEAHARGELSAAAYESISR